MLRTMRHLIGATVAATDETVGELDDAYFDDRHWAVRYLVVRSDEADHAAPLMVSPVAVEAISEDASRIDLAVDKESVEKAPGVGHEQPVSVQRERAYYDYYGWPYYWQGPGVWGAWSGAAGMRMLPVGVPPDRVVADELSGQEEAEAGAAGSGELDETSRHLRSANEVIGYFVEATDHEVGHVEDLLLDPDSWRLTAVVVDTSNWWFGKRVAVPSEHFVAVDWETETVSVDLTRAQVKAEHEYRPEDAD